MNYYKQGDATKAEQIKAAFEKLGIDVLDFGFADKTVVYCSIGSACVQSLPYSINLMNILHSHPGYQELPLPVEPLFHAGDWLYHNTLGVHPILVKDYSKRQGYKVECIRTTYYLQKGVVENEYHLWSISDAKDGDVITNGKLIVIFNKLEEPAYKQHIVAYAGLDLCGRLQITEGTWQLGVDKAMPATKEQRDFFFTKMREAGYEWDEKKKELRKIKPHYNVANFKPKQWVLVRDDDEWEWALTRFSYLSNGSASLFVCINGASFQQCIPYEGNEALLGTTKPCDERFINW